MGIIEWFKVNWDKPVIDLRKSKDIVDKAKETTNDQVLDWFGNIIGDWTARQITDWWTMVNTVMPDIITLGVIACCMVGMVAGMKWIGRSVLLLMIGIVIIIA